MKDKLEIILIAAVSENNVIGYRGDIPWDIKEDMARFRELTIGHCVIMGRKTYESLPSAFNGNGFPNRTNIILTSQNMEIPREVLKCKSLEEALDFAKEHIIARERNKKIYVIGGQRVYEEAINHLKATRLEITKVMGKYYKGDAFFPEINEKIWKKLQVNEEDKYDGYSFETYARR